MSRNEGLRNSATTNRQVRNDTVEVLLWLRSIEIVTRSGTIDRGKQYPQKVPNMPTRPKIFLSHMVEDEGVANELEKRLQFCGYDFWNSPPDGPQRDWGPKLERTIANSEIAILLVTPNYVSSEWICASELPKLLEREKTKCLRVLPIVLKSCSLIDTQLEDHQVFPRNGKALAELSKAEKEHFWRDLADSITQRREQDTGLKYDVFISHASEDKDAVAGPLAKALQEQGLRVWLDQFELKIGDSLQRSINEGLAESRFGVVILSPSFLAKEWPKKELDALTARETGRNKPVILPVWHNITADDVARFSPILADRLAVSTAQGISSVARSITEAALIQTQGAQQAVATRLESIVERLERLEKRSAQHVVSESHSETDNNAPDEVFIVHGHDVAARESVCRFIERIGARPVVLAEQPNQGRTIIEKFEDHSKVKFAVVLLTPDDVGGVRSAPDDIGFRARQNVILELGYFLGKLGRARFCILNKGGLEMPSDIHGMLWIEMDPAHGWRISLARELRHAGVRIDFNRVLE